MRIPEDMGGFGRVSRVPSRSRTGVIALLTVLVVLLLSVRAIARFYTDFLWFDSLSASDVWRIVLSTKVLLGAGFTAVFAAFLFLNLRVAGRLAPDLPMFTPEEEALVRFRELIEPRLRLFQIGVASVFGLVAGLGAASAWREWLLFRNGGSFGSKDPLFSRDFGFYVFKLPFLAYVSDWIFASLVVVVLVVAASHYMNGGIRLQVMGQRVTPQVKAHLSVLFGMLALAKAAGYWMDRFDLLQSSRGYVRGATYTDVVAQDPALKLLILISLLSAVLFIVNIWQRGWALPVVALASWAAVALVAGAAYPAFVQQFQVARKESAREAKYIKRNIQATRYGLGLQSVTENNFTYSDKPSDAAAAANQATVSNIRLNDPTVSVASFKKLQSLLGYYQFSDIDVDRYPIGADGANSAVVLAARELNPDGLPNDSWESQHLIYTHGYGVALAAANAVTTKGLPDFKVSGVSPLTIDPALASTITLDRPQLYFSESVDGSSGDGYAIVNTSRQEESPESTKNGSKYEGSGGVSMSGFVRRAAFALRFGDLEALTSEYLTDQSKVLYVRGVRERVHNLAPFLQLDSDAYPVMVDGRIKYVLDGYTTSDQLPYGELADTSQVPVTLGGYGLRDVSFNYVRNSVKAVVDAYDGTVTLYLADTLYGSKDPIIRAYARQFPGLFTSSIPEDLRQHFRYPEDLFRVQTAMWGRYHSADPSEFYSRADQWDVAQDPGLTLDSSGSAGPIEPYYMQMRLPGAVDEDFVLFRPFVAYSSDNSKTQLTSFMVAQSDPAKYGQLATFTMVTEDGERDRDVDGPLTVNSRMLSTTKGNLSQDLSQLNSGGSKVKLGNLLIVPIDQGLLYVRPIYVAGADEDSAPALRRVVIAMGDRTAVGNTLQEALADLFPTAGLTTLEGRSEDSDSADGGTPSGDAGGSGEVDDNSAKSPEEQLAEAITLFQEADDALKSGGVDSFDEYATKVKQAQELVQDAQSQLSGGGE